MLNDDKAIPWFAVFCAVMITIFAMIGVVNVIEYFVLHLRWIE